MKNQRSTGEKSYIENQRMLKCYRFYQTCCDFHSTVSAFQNDCQKTYPGNREFRSSLHQPIVYTFVLHIKTHLQPNRVGSFFFFPFFAVQDSEKLWSIKSKGLQIFYMYPDEKTSVTKESGNTFTDLHSSSRILCF